MIDSMFKWGAALAALMVSVVAAPAGAQPLVYVLGSAPTPDISSHQLTVFDPATNTRLGRLLLGRTQGSRVEGIAIAPDGGRIYVVNSLDYTVSVVSLRPHAVEAPLPTAVVGENPFSVAVSPDSQRLYVSGQEYINNRSEGFLTVVDTVSRVTLTKIPIGVGGAYGVAASPDGSRVYVVTGEARAIAVVSTATNSILTTVPLDGASTGLSVTLSPDGRFAYIPRRPTASGTPGFIQVLDTTTNTIVAAPTVGLSPWHVGVSPNGAFVYAPSAQSNVVHRLNPSTHASAGTTAIPGAFAVAFLPNSSRAYVAAGLNVFAVDTATNTAVASIPLVINRGFGSEGGATAVVVTPPPFVPPGPTNFQATAISGNRVTLTWTPPLGASPTGYVVEGGVGPGEVLGSLPTGSAAPTFTFDAPTGAFFVRVHALTASGRSAASNEIRILVNVPLPPSPPTGLLGLANGANLALNWKAGAAGGPPTSFILDVTGALTLTMPIGAADTFAYAGVPPGTYNFAVRAANGSGASTASTPVTLTFPNACPGPPQVPTNFTVSRAGSLVSVSWDPPNAGPAVTGYVLHVTGALNLSLPLTTRSASGLVSSGTYNLSVLAVNPCGTGIETPTQSITVP